MGGISLSAKKPSNNFFNKMSMRPFRQSNAMQDIPEEGTTKDGNYPQTTMFAAPTIDNLQKYQKTMNQHKMGVRSFARTEKHSVKSYMSNLSSMSNFFKVTDSPFGGVIPSRVLRVAMEKRQQ